MRGLYKTNIEKRMEEALIEENIKFTSQFPIRCRFGYILDFAIPDLKIDIECDGEAWHPIGNSRDRNRNWFLRNNGWTILRFRGNEILNDIHTCVNKIKDTIKKEEEKHEIQSRSERDSTC